MSLSRMTGATTAPALLTWVSDVDPVHAAVAALRRSIRRPAAVVVGSDGPDPTADVDAPFVLRAVRLERNETRAMAGWARLARAAIADKLICLDEALLPGPSLVGAFEHALERVDALVQGPVQVLTDGDREPVGRPRRSNARLVVERTHTHPEVLNFAVHRRTLLKRICGADVPSAPVAAELLARAERAGVPIAWQSAAVAFAAADAAVPEPAGDSAG